MSTGWQGCAWSQVWSRHSLRCCCMVTSNRWVANLGTELDPYRSWLRAKMSVWHWGQCAVWKQALLRKFEPQALWRRQAGDDSVIETRTKRKQKKNTYFKLRFYTLFSSVLKVTQLYFSVTQGGSEHNLTSAHKNWLFYNRNVRFVPKHNAWLSVNTKP